MNFQYESDRIYLEDEAGNIIAEIDFPDDIITHTFVDDSLRGQGIASQLVEKAVQAIEAKGKTAQATCSYAKHWLEKNR